MMMHLSARRTTTLRGILHRDSRKCFSSGAGSISSSDEDNDDSAYVKAEAIDLSVDLQSSSPGDRIQVPYELTVSESIHDFWQSAFHSQDRIHTSTPFARKIGLQDRMLPFSLVSFLTSSMTHADAALVQVALDNAIYHWPAFAGDTFKKSFQVKSVRNTSDGNHTVINFSCELSNQRGRVCMSLDKRMMFPFAVPPSTLDNAPIVNPMVHTQQLLRDHLLSKAQVLSSLGSQSLARLRPQQTILHSMHRSLSLSQSQQLASLAKLTHERHFDIRKYDPKTEILVPGGLVLGLVLSATSRDLHEVLHEELLHVSYTNPVHPGDVIGAITYVHDIDDTIATGNLECLTVTTIGVKNMEARDLEAASSKLPLDLFEHSNSLPKQIERICKKKCPLLSHRIVVQVTRKIIRQSRRQDIFLL